MTGTTYKLAELNLDLYESSLAEKDGIEFGLCRTARGKKLAALRKSEKMVLPCFEGEFSESAVGDLMICPLNPINTQELRSQLDWLIPRPLGSATSAGLGDRIGLATPGHVRAVKAAKNIRPIFAQQSIREMAGCIPGGVAGRCGRGCRSSENSGGYRLLPSIRIYLLHD